MQIITRKEAHKLGCKHFYTGKPCKYGHYSTRYVTSGNCVECNNSYKAVRTITPRSQAIRNGEKYYVTGEPCANGHYGLRYTKSGNCLECLGRDVSPAQQFSPRQQAINDNAMTYESKKPCKHGHTSPRYTSTGNCVECVEQVKLARLSQPHQIAPRQQAINANEPFYNTGKPCTNGHYSMRYTSNGGCLECAEQVKVARQQARERQQQAARAQAAQRGDRYYNSGQRCPQGHKGVRYVPTDECVECIAPTMTHDQLARYNLARHTLKPTAVDLQDAQLQQRLCPPSEYNYWRKIITLIKRKINT